MNKKYHVYGIGNALVDVEHRVDDLFLKKRNIEKGVMTLVDEEGQNILHATLKDKRLEKSCGGSAANTLVALSCFGGKAFFSCKVADDEYGRFYLDELKDAGVATKAHVIYGDGATGNCLVMVTPDAERTLYTYLGVTVDVGWEDVDQEALIDSEFFYVEGYLAPSEIARHAVVKAMQLAKSNGVRTALSMSDLSMVEYFRKELNELIDTYVDVLFCNETEAFTYTGYHDIDMVVEKLKKIAGTVVLTRGSKGAVIATADGVVEISAHQVDAVDTNGAGDIFAGAFLYGIIHGYTAEDAGNFASFSAARLVAVMGARLKNDEYSSVLEAYQQSKQ